MRPGPIAMVVALAVFAAGCDREKRDFTSDSGVAAHTARLTDLQPGAPSPPPVMQSPLNGNAYGLSEGKRLFSWFNCVGCHHHGGGGIGPALMDHRWIYGSRPDQIYSAIVQGRPNGMPSYAGRLTDQQVWQLVAYVESLGGNAAKDAAPGRDDDMSSSKPEMRRELRPPVQTGHR
jgi:cytochrome c oxidase cbb3-type subunit III